MTAGFRREIELLSTWMIFMLILGAVVGQVLVALCIGLLVYTIWTLYNLNRLTQWLGTPSKNIPETFALWDEVYYQLYHLYQRQRKARRKLTSMLTKFRKSTQALPYATIVLNDHDEIEWYNAAASHMFSLHAGQDVGQRVDNLIRQPEFAAYLSKRKYKNPLEFQNNQQKVLLNITPYGSGQYLLSARDITLRSQLDETRRDFIANASHELRTPITVMSGYIEMMREREDETTKLPLDMIQQQTIRMESIISKLIELAKLETSEIIEEPGPVDISELLHEIHNEAIALDRGEHEIVLSIEPIKINGNHDELRMAFMNLLTNAIRYTPESQTIKLFSSSDENGVCVGVKDEGIGIAYEHIHRLTERFYRVDAGRSREKGGTGLGLAIVKHVLDRHGASLYINSEPGKGSLFRCYFPNVQQQ